jgi:hypothetical protein
LLSVNRNLHTVLPALERELPFVWNTKRGIPPLPKISKYALRYIGVFPLLHLKYSTEFVKCKHLFEKFLEFFWKLCLKCKICAIAELILKILLTTTVFYARIIFGGQAKCPLFLFFQAFQKGNECSITITRQGFFISIQYLQSIKSV